MPGYRTHLVGGGVAALLIFIFLAAIGCGFVLNNYLFATGLLFAALAGSLFPDIDVKSKGQHYFYWVLLALLVYHYTYNAMDYCMIIAVVAILPLLTKHRGILHNIWFLMLLTFLCMKYVTKHCSVYAPIMCCFLLFFLIGMISHLWLDLGTRRMFRLPWRLRK